MAASLSQGGGSMGASQKKEFKAMLPSQGSLRAPNSTTFRLFSNSAKPETTENTKLADLKSCMDETSEVLRSLNAKSLERGKAGGRQGAAFGSGQRQRPGAAGMKKNVAPSRPKSPKFFSHNSKKSIDGYFSAKLSQSINNLTKSTDMLKLSKSANAPAKTNGLILKCKCRRFKVGKAESRYPSDVRFFHDRTEYCFVRESQFGKDHISMVMFYKDMISAKLSTQQGAFVYKIPRHLHHYFQDYEPENEHHIMKVKFDKQSEVNAFKADVLPVILGQCNRTISCEDRGPDWRTQTGNSRSRSPVPRGTPKIVLLKDM